MAKKNKKAKSSENPSEKLSALQLQREILRLFKRHPRLHLNPKQVTLKLQVANNTDSVQHAINKLVEGKKLIELGDYKYQLNEKRSQAARKIYEGTVDMTRTGSAYVTCEGLSEDVHVSPKYMNSALHGDKVKLSAWIPRGRRRPEGEVIEVLQRATSSFVGVIGIYPRYAIVTPDGNTPVDILVDLKETLNAKDGDKVVVKIKDWTSEHFDNPRGEVTFVLGQAGSHDIEMKAILLTRGFKLHFTDETLAESAALPGEIADDEIAKRWDMRSITTFTIDPDNAKDFDDALSYRQLPEGLTEIGVHIADVAHYVKQGSSLDKEAFERSTSVYLVDRVLPMLPERLSNELCSLRPHEDKLTFSAVFTFDATGKIIKKWFGRTVIHSNRRFTYEEAQAILESKAGEFAAELSALNTLAYQLRSDRFENGAINFETEEVKFRLDEHGSPIDVFVKERKDSHLLIEDFMLLANKEVAAYIAEKGKEQEIPYVYRVHDEPNLEKVEEFAKFTKELGFEINTKNPRTIAKSFNQLVKAAESDHSLKMIAPLAIRTMAKAAYSTENIGHYGLAFAFYTHFTSPIRRYSDVLAHRLLEKNLGSKDFYRANKMQLEEYCLHISTQERKAMEAERESVKYKQAEYMEKHVGEVFRGCISGIVDRGVFVDLIDNHCEGLATFNKAPEPFEVAENRLRVRGQISRKEYKIGDEISVRIVATDRGRRLIEMEWIAEQE